MNPVTEQEEDFSMSVSPEATKSKYVIAEGKYPATCTDLTKGTSQNGNEMYIFSFIGTGGAAEGREFTLRVLTAAKFQWKLLKTLKGFGIGLSKDGNGEPFLSLKKKDVVGKDVTLELEQNTPPGSSKTFMDVVNVWPAGEAPARSSADPMPM